MKYALYRFGKRFNNKTFVSYEEARKYARRKTTEQLGMYFDDLITNGWSIRRV